MAMSTLPSHVVQHLLEHCPGRTDEALQPRFGISYNTWRAIVDGRAIRASVAARLIDRLATEKSYAKD